MLKGVAKKDIALLKNPSDETTLYKLAIEQADGIILQSPNINSELIEYAKSLGKPILEYQSPEEYANACNEFYDVVMESANDNTQQL